MCRKLFFLIYLILVWGLSTPISAATLLASYEPSEVNCLMVVGRPNTVDVNWPLLGGVNDVPPATEGDYVLRLRWTGEINKVEVGHYWTCTKFDLDGVDYILVDVYFPKDTNIPEIIGIWDDIFGWTEAVCLPCTMDEWHTILFYVGNRHQKDLDHIFALLFEKLVKDYGTIFVDNLRLGSLDDVTRRQLSFAGYNWLIKDTGCGTQGPGPNYFSHSKENVWVDENGYLHLRIAQRCDKWFCSEVILDASPGYGTYVFTTEGEVVDPNIVLGLFTWDTDAPHHHYREIDIELSQWWDPNEPNNAQYVVQPWNTPGNRHRFNIEPDSKTITHEFSWQPDNIDFRSYYGDCPLVNPNNVIENWTYSGSDVPPAGGENARINFWLLPPKGIPWGTPSPTDGQDAEIVIKNFRYLRNITAKIDICPDTLNLSSKGRWITCLIRFGKNCRIAGIDSNSVFLEGKIKAEQVWSYAPKQVAMAKFSYSKVQKMLAEMDKLGDVELTVTGQLTDGTRFKGTDTVRVIKGWKK